MRRAKRLFTKDGNPVNVDVLNGELRVRAGRRKKQPERETKSYPTIVTFGQQGQKKKYLYKPTPRNLRYFSHSPMGRRAINAIKNPIAMLDWRIVPIDGVDLNAELEQQIEVAKFCFNHPNNDDSLSTFMEQIVEDYCIGASAIEMQLSGDENRPLWMWPVDGLSIQIYPLWDGDKSEPRYAQVVGYGTALGGGVITELRNDELIYIKPNGSTATPFGFGPIEIAFNTINAMLGVAEFDNNVSSNQRPSIMLDMGEGFTDKHIVEFRSYWQNEIEGQGKTPIVGSMSDGRSDEKTKRGASVERLYPEGDKGMFLEYQEWLCRVLAACFDLSPQNLGIEADVNRNTSETAADRDWQQAIKPVAQKIAAHLTREALHGKLGFSQLRFTANDMDRENELNNASIYEKRYKNNAITPNEYRAKLGENPMDSEWGDMTFADVEIAMWAARGAGQVDDKALTKGAKSKPKKGK